ncbi:hypothetical protein ACFQ4C_04270 [Larkinella insperata]|uniref:Uncharacterized protein n=1 Tax=Larkinella insperata TaxID=332158 RepID=A0ABW3Q5A2_9BACT|nr:hypothetical protein [Larkinella insperata]
MKFRFTISGLPFDGGCPIRVHLIKLRHSVKRQTSDQQLVQQM